MRKVLFALVLVLSMSVSAFAQETSSSDRVRELMKAISFNNMLELFHARSNHAVENQTRQMLAQLQKSFPGIPEDLMSELNRATDEFKRKMNSSWSTDEAARVYSSTLAKQLTEKDIQRSIEHYSTPEGKKEIKAIIEAAMKMNNYIEQSMQKESEVAISEFIARIRAIAGQAVKKDEKREPVKDQ